MSEISTGLYEWQGLGMAIACAIIWYPNSTVAQIIPDDTLPNNSSVTLNGNTTIIEGGTTRGANLFHNFKEFSLPTGSDAWFNNAQDIQNILTRVTGGSISNIDGLIRANGKANLFLLNPSGIVFGANAQLDIGGSFLASTANSLKFADGFEFSATSPQTTPLLTISVPVGLQYGNNTKSVQVRGSILEGKPGETLALVGGNVSVEGGALRSRSDSERVSPSGRIELGGVADSGMVEIKGQQSEGVFKLTSLLFPTVGLNDVLLNKGAVIDVTGAGGGSIAFNARNLDVVSGSVLLAGIGEGLGSIGTVAGDITLNATQDIKFVGSGVFNNVRPQAVGNGGNINISALSLSLTDGTLVVTGTFGEGDAGNVNVDITGAVTISGGKNGIPSAIESTVQTGAKGKGGNINLFGGSFFLINGAQFSASTLGQGNAGNVKITARDSVSLTNAAIFSTIEAGGVGKGGNIDINAATLSVTDGALLLTSVDKASTISSFGQGDAGNINVDVTGVVTIAGVKNGIYSGILSYVEPGAKGKGGNIAISGGSLSLTDGARLVTSTYEEGNAGNVNVDVTGAVTIAGVKDGFFSAIGSSVEPGAKGDGGDIAITGDSFSLIDGAQLVASTFEEGKAGNVNINVTGAVTISGRKDGSSSAIGSLVVTGAKGKGGNITISGGSFSLTDGAVVSASTLGEGDAGNVHVDVQSGAVTISGRKDNSSSAIGSTVESGAKGKGGNITISGGSFSLTEGAVLSVSTLGEGNAGNIDLNFTGAVTISGVKDGLRSAINSATGTGTKGNGGNIMLSGSSLSLTDGATLFASTLGEGNAGSVFLQASSFVAVANDAKIFSTVESFGVGNGGNINISTERVFLKDAAQITASSVGNGAAGNLNVNARTIFLDNSTLSTDTRSRDNNPNIEQATITISARDLMLLRRGSKITTNASGENIIGGNININTNFLVGLEDSDITANSTDSRGGNVRINTKGIFGIQFRDLASPLTSDITATGITPPEIDPTPTSGLVELPTNLVDASNQISTACTPGSRQFQNTFVATGRGGLPHSPTEPLQDSSTIAQWVRWRSPINAQTTQSSVSARRNSRSHSQTRAKTTELQTRAISVTPKVAVTTTPIVEARSWVVDVHGNIELVAQAPSVNPHSPWQTPASCVVFQ